VTTTTPYEAGDRVRALVRTERGTTLATGTVADCSPSGGGRWVVRVRACDTDHTFTVAGDGSDANGYLQRAPGVVVGRRNCCTATTNGTGTS